MPKTVNVKHWTELKGNKYRTNLHPDMVLNPQRGYRVHDMQDNTIKVFDKDYFISKLQRELIAPLHSDFELEGIIRLIQTAYCTTDSYYLKSLEALPFEDKEHDQLTLDEEFPDEF